VPWVAVAAAVIGCLLAWRFRERIRRLLLGDDDPGGRAPQPAS
jgi:hypothetical protein